MHQGTPFQSINPSDGTVVWEGSSASSEAVEAALAASRLAFSDWSQTTIEERETILRRFAERLRSEGNELAELIAREIGKPLWEARTEVAAMAGKIEISIEAHARRCAEFPGGVAVTRFRPHGVLVVLGPYNFPGHLPNGHICPALLAGNTVVFKPSELAPATGEWMLNCWLGAGLPEGVLQVLQGGADTAVELTRHAEINGILFTGSAATGKRLAASMASTPGKILALEMGGNNPLIVDSDNVKDIPSAAEIILRSAFLSAGQRCTCARRLILIESSRADTLLDELLDRTRAIHVDDPFSEPPPFMGPLASPAFPGQVLKAQENLSRTGGKVLLEARELKPGTGFLTPGIIDVSDVTDLPDEEVFGPLLQVVRVKDLDTAINVANNTRYGLAAGILTDLSGHYQMASEHLQAGIINWNVQLTGASSAAPFGGIKDSGNLRPSAFLAADYCSYPVASMEIPHCGPQPPMPGRPD
ncbi:MAG: succinylglutamate-semialdehyde dehydrogenase [Puniceicoccaceae bacterium]